MLVFAIPLGGLCQARTASVKGYGHSMVLGPTNPINDAQLGSVQTLFTTPDGRTDVFPLVNVVGQTTFFGGEAKPTSIGSTSYSTDYAAHSSIFGFVETGNVRLTIPSADSDGNGMFDFLQFDQSVNRSLSGSIFADTGESAGFSGTFIRSQGARIGAYSIVISGQGVRSGSWTVISILGTANYIRGEQNTISFSVIAQGEISVNVSTSSTPYTINSGDQISIPPMLFSTSDSLLFSQTTTTLTRSGNTYRGLITLIDGDTTTSWQDYKQYILEVTDNNDSDSDGIPDLSDPIPHPIPQLALTHRGSLADIKWPNTAYGFALQSRDSMSSGAWTPVSSAPADVSGGMKQVTVGSGSTAKFFRLAR
jgi:hypothetical protein